VEGGARDFGSGGAVTSKLPRARIRAWQVAAAALAALAAGALWYWWRGRDLALESLIQHLPPAEAVVLHADVAALRRAGIVDLVAGSRAAEESDYQRFVTESGFNYREDLDTVLASFANGEAHILLRGRFNWKALEAYAAGHGGGCEKGFCRLPASTPGRHISFFALRPKVLALASGPNPWGAAAMRAAVATRPNLPAPSRPLWLYVPGAAFRSAGGERMPAGTRLFAKALEEAESALLWVGPAGAGLEAQLEASCKSEEAAVMLKAQLETVTDVLRKLISRTGGQPNPADLSGVLTQGTFRREGRRVIGRWPLARAFLESLAGGR
jgi:hypothetical protein